MNVNVQVVGLATVFEAWRRNEEVEVEFSGKTVRELIGALTGEFGTHVRRTLLVETGDFDPGIRVLLNGVIYPVETIMRAILKEGDTLTFHAPS